MSGGVLLFFSSLDLPVLFIVTVTGSLRKEAQRQKERERERALYYYSNTKRLLSTYLGKAEIEGRKNGLFLGLVTFGSHVCSIAWLCIMTLSLSLPIAEIARETCVPHTHDTPLFPSPFLGKSFQSPDNIMRERGRVWWMERFRTRPRFHNYGSIVLLVTSFSTGEFLFPTHSARALKSVNIYILGGLLSLSLRPLCLTSDWARNALSFCLIASLTSWEWSFSFSPSARETHSGKKHFLQSILRNHILGTC